MTLDDVVQAKQALEAAGERVSGNSLVQYFHRHGQPCAKRTALRLLAQVPPPTPALRTPPPPAPAPVPDDPVQVAAARVVACQSDLDEARAQMRQAVIEHALVRGVLHDNRRLCALDPQDPAAQVAVQMAEDATQLYRNCWQEYRSAQAHLAQVQAAQQRQAQEAWVAQHAPHLLAAYLQAGDALQAAEGERATYVAKHRMHQATFDYMTAIAQAPVGANGTTH